MLVKRLVQLQFCLDKVDKPQIMLNQRNIVNLDVCKCICQGITHLKGVLQFRSNSGFRILLS